MEQIKSKTKFPFYLFLTYVIYYCGHAVFNTYHSVFLSQSGFSESAIGLIGSIGTIILLLVQPLWGILSDRSGHKSRIAGALMIMSGLTCLAIYLSKSLWWIAGCVIVLTIFFTPSTTLQDNCTLELTEGTGWDFGNIRLGGTIGYALFALVMGFFIKSYESIYCWLALFCMIAGVMFFMIRMNHTAPTEKKKKEKMHYGALFRNKALICLIIYNILYSISGTFGRYFSIYFAQELGATSLMLSLATMISCPLELPCFWYAGRIQKKLGIRNTLTLAALTQITKMILLAVVTDPWAVVAVHVIGGCSFPFFNFCVLNYINDQVPNDMRATAQSFSAILASIFPSILFAPIAGICSDYFGCQITLVIGATILLCSMLGFRLVFGKLTKGQPGM